MIAIVIMFYYAIGDGLGRILLIVKKVNKNIFGKINFINMIINYNINCILIVY